MGLWSGLWLTGIEYEQHNDLAGLQGGQAGEYYHLTALEYSKLPVYDSHIADGTIHFTEASLNLPTTYLKLDCSNDPLTGILNTQHILPNISTTYDLGDSSNFFRTLYLKNQGGNVLYCEPVQSGQPATSYTAFLGGGYIPGEQNQGGIFQFEMGNIGSTLGTSKNQIIFELGQPDFATVTTNDFIIQSFNGISTYAFVAAFGGFNNPEYGWQLRRLTGAEISSKALIFDNQLPISDVRRSIDFRINSINVLTIENETSTGAGDFTVDFPLGDITAPSLLTITAPVGLQVNGYGAITSSTVFNLLDVFTVKATTLNVPVTLGMRPDGTNTSSLIFVTNSSDTTNYGVLEGSVNGTTAQLVTWRINSGIGPTILNIGEKTSNFLGVGTFDSLTTIDFYFANAIECQIQPNTIVFNNGVINTQIDWTVNGQLGFQVATNDIIRISATLAQITQNTNITGNLTLTTDNNRIYWGTGQDVDSYYDGTDFWVRTDLQNPSDWNIDCGTNKTIELQESVWDDMNVGGVTLRQGVTNQPTLINFDTTTILVYSFAPNLTNELHGNFEIAHDYKEGTNLKPHLHWYPQNTNTGNVLWRLEYTIESTTGTVVSGTIDMLVAANGTAWQKQVDSWTDITGTNVKINHQFHFRLARVGGDATDTYTDNASIATFGLHYEIDTMGSRQVMVK